MLSFLQQPSIPPLPEGTRLETSTPPSSQQLNTLLMSCGESTHPEERWELALQRSLWQISILDESTGELIGFVRATSDLALNANLWNLAAKPGPNQGALFAVLVHRALQILRRRRICRARCTSCLLYTSPSPRDYAASRMPSSA